MTSPFNRFFRAATDGRDPYQYQERFGTAVGWPHLLRAPTGAGKTATAVLGWLYRWVKQAPDTPRRLVYCLPMRVLVEQSFREATHWVGNLTRAGVLREPIAVHRLMGGVEAEEWYLHPERPAVLIGTQDMLLSRALNRGYAANRFHWTIDFGLLNNDCLWVYDEPQLMGSGVSTSAQLAGMRRMLGTFGPSPSVWMSATLEPGWLDTVDFRGKFPGQPLELGDDDYADPRLDKRMTAAKTLAPLGLTASKDGKEVAKAVWANHTERGGQTLVVLNTVERAKTVFAELDKLRRQTDRPTALLVHSRFRPHERDRLNDLLQEQGDAAADRIIVATQVVEAGVDISARTLVTELAPWASIVQRIGRCNRTGDDGSRDHPARVFWIDVAATEPEEKEDRRAALPYLVADLNRARDRVEALAGKDVSPRSLEPFRLDADFPHTHVLRRRDLLGLFDTAPDLSGNDIDVKHYVRGDEDDLDVKVFWRRWDGDRPPPNESRPRRAELCNVPVGQFRQFLTGEVVGFVWDHLERKWARLDPRQLRPGLTVLLPETAGGYDPYLGWTGDPKHQISPLPDDGRRSQPEEAAESDPLSETAVPRTVAAHTESVCRAVERIIRKLSALSPADRDHLQKAARWHDAGKGHWVFQEAVRRLNPALSEGEQWAKSGKPKLRLRYDRSRRRFRHELASALAVLRHRPDWPFIVAYLIAAHHGKVRLSIRALPGEEPPDPGKLYALGVLDGDELPPVYLGGETCPAAPLDLSPMRLGGESSWTARALRLLTEIGPFRLAYLEAILRAADQWVSDQEREGREP